MTTRDQIVRTALGFNGTGNGQGFAGEHPPRKATTRSFS
jgi:hypothetical protein